MKFKLKYLLYIVALVSLASCSVTKQYQAPQVQTDDLFRDYQDTDTTSLAKMPWQSVFKDSLLQKLILQGMEQNIDLQIAYSRVRQAEWYYRQSRSALYPTLSANAGVTESRLPEAQGLGIRTHMSQYNLGLNSSWEADIWGRLSSAKRANLAMMLQSEAGAKAVRSGLIANIANLYYELLALDNQLHIAQRTVQNWDSTVVTMEKLKEAARVTDAAVVQSKAQRYAVETTIPDIIRQIKETENALSILLGNTPGEISRSKLSEQPDLDSLAAGIPVQLLANRPDVQQAELGYRSTFELVNAARASFYPTLSITASAGLNSLNIDRLLNPASIAASLMAGLTQPIFNQRQLKTNLRVTEEEQSIAFLRYKNTLLTAGREVSDALLNHTTAIEKLKSRTRQIEELEKAVNYTQRLLSNGFADYLEVISARQNLLTAENGQVGDKLQQLQAIVSLYRALGGSGE